MAFMSVFFIAFISLQYNTKDVYENQKKFNVNVKDAFNKFVA